MFTAKDLEVRVISQSLAKAVIKRYHYSGKTTSNSQIHFGIYLNGKLEGALQYGPSIDKRRMAQNLCIGFNEALELNRMALSDNCPKNSESRVIGITLRILRKKYPHLKVIISFADACQCGDGTIYRASGFKLHSFKKNNSLIVHNGAVVDDKTFNDIILPNGESLHCWIKKNSGVVSKKSVDDVVLGNGRYLSSYLTSSYKPLNGYQMKYLYFFDKELEKKFRFVKFDEIPDDVRMYKGNRRKEHDSNVS